MKKEEVFISADFGYKPKWWQKILAFFGFKISMTDYSCVVFWRKKRDGTYELLDIKYH